MQKRTKTMLLSAIAAVTVLVTGCSSSGKYVDGTYDGTGKGVKSDIKVAVEIKDEKIEGITVKEHKETEAMIDAAVENTIPEIIEKQTTEGVDALSGASGSSGGIIEAVAQALEQAKKK
ncbi:FMN-binding protein [Paenibacillus tritici]|uniref:FMN-binding protein n=1 Tax=Paenibacillus tritici TaxID=1873425 RepID=A0ABX2DWL7_9BACL|nr:FMN-binding protein [Paenibacillus tritici]NQX48211.1 FMN-binding protein [Paenibacillus tritici]QUL56563.1 FMN-binding protein [Paenibacillus tritici]